MSYTVKDAINKKDNLIKGLEDLYEELKNYKSTPALTPTERDDIRNQMVKLVIEIEHRKTMDVFLSASLAVIRPPDKKEVDDMKATLTKMGKKLNTIGNVRNVIKFVEEVMTENADRFSDILETIG